MASSPSPHRDGVDRGQERPLAGLVGLVAGVIGIALCVGVFVRPVLAVLAIVPGLVAIVAAGLAAIEARRERRGFRLPLVAATLGAIAVLFPIVGLILLFAAANGA